MVRRCSGRFKAHSPYFTRDWISRWVGSIFKQDYTVKLLVIPGHCMKYCALLIRLKLKAKSNSCKTCHTYAQRATLDYWLFAHFIISPVIKHLQCWSFAVRLVLNGSSYYWYLTYLSKQRSGEPQQNSSYSYLSHSLFYLRLCTP